MRLPVFYLILKYSFYQTVTTIQYLMKKTLVIIILLAVLAGSCARGITPYEAANGKAKCGRYLK